VVRPAPIERRLHALLSERPVCFALADLPTPVERAKWLDLSGVTAWVKRDDLTSEIYGGGKVRKLEWILANPPYDGDDPIVTIGGYGSHHLLATALYLEPLGRELHAVVFDQPYTEHAYRNFAVTCSVGSRVWSTRSKLGLPWAFASYYLWRRPPQMGRYLTPGASSVLGAFGCVEAGLELADQIAAGELPAPDRLYVTAGTAGTSAGIAIGLAIRGVPTHLRLVSAAEKYAFNAFMFRRKLHAVFYELVRRGLPDAPLSVEDLLAKANVGWSITHRQLGSGYGFPTEEATAAVALAREHELSLETTYTGKCVAALRADLRDGVAKEGSNVLFWNTHGANDLRAKIVDGWEDKLPSGIRARLESARNRALGPA
jgi:D-cysteine desulfhydrase